MRISTSLIFDRGVGQINAQQGQFQKVSEQIASGRRVVNPSDDPQSAARAVAVGQSISQAEQFREARVSVRNSLSQQESILATVTDSIVRARVLLAQGANGSLSDSDRRSVAGELRGVYEALIGQANANNGNGQYLFGGYQDGSDPFVKDAFGDINYVGDNNQREERIDNSRLIEVAETGETVFRTVQTTAGYVTEVDAANTGNVTFQGPKVLDSADPLYGSAFTIDFVVDGLGPRYTVNGGPEIPYVDGANIAFGGLTLELKGQPADGDQMVVDKAENLETSLFTNLESLIDALDTDTTLPVDEAAMKNVLTTSFRKLAHSLDNVLVVRAEIGAKLNELDAVDAIAEQRMLNLTSTKSDLIDVDMVEAISEYTLRQVGLQAAQRAFVDIGRNSLFEYL